MSETKESNIISCEPEWHGMFNYAISLTKDSIPKDKGMETVVQMLKFGQDLYAVNKKLEQLLEDQRKEES